MRNAIVFMLLGSLLLLGGCKYLPKLDEVLPDQTKEYRKSESLPDLEVPPDLTSEAIQDNMSVPQVDESGTATYSTYQERIRARKEARQAQHAQGTVALADEQLLVVKGSTIDIWPRLRGFWQERGFKLDLDDQDLGVLETSWREDPVEFKRDRFKLFTEPGDDEDMTVIYLSHEGESQKPEGEELVWKPRPRDLQLEDTVTARLGDYLGNVISSTAQGAKITPVAAKPAARTTAPRQRRKLAELINAGGGKRYVAFYQGFEKAWSATQKAVQELGLKIKDRDHARGILDVEYHSSSKKSIFKRMLSWTSQQDTYLVSLTGVGEKTEIVILDSDGRWDDSKGAMELLDMINNQLNHETPRATVSKTAGAAATRAVTSRKPATSSVTQKQLAEIINTSGGKHYISILQDIDKAWVSMEQALKALDIDINDTNQRKGLFDVQFHGSHKKSILTRMLSWSGQDSYIIRLTGVGSKTEVVILDSDGRWDDSKNATELLDMINSQLNH